MRFPEIAVFSTFALLAVRPSITITNEETPIFPLFIQISLLAWSHLDRFYYVPTFFILFYHTKFTFIIRVIMQKSRPWKRKAPLYLT
jgi:hypothetical protein